MTDDELEAQLTLRDEDLLCLKMFEAEVIRWSKVKNLVSGPSAGALWRRHVLDSVQVQRSLPRARVWADLGSGGGFPGIITAILLKGVSGAVVHLVESDNRKCAFLRAVSRETAAPTIVHHGRIENVVLQLSGIEAVSARALAPLDQLVTWANPLLEKAAVAVFPKGRSVRNELTRLSADSNYEIDIRPSITDLDASLVTVRRRLPIGALQ